MRSGLRVHFYINGFVFQNTVKVQDPSALSSALSPKSFVSDEGSKLAFFVLFSCHVHYG